MPKYLKDFNNTKSEIEKGVSEIEAQGVCYLSDVFASDLPAAIKLEIAAATANKVLSRKSELCCGVGARIDLFP